MSPVAQKSKAAAPAKQMRAASLLPDDMVSGGLMDDFDGTIDKVRFVPWDYNGNIDHSVLAVAVDITPDEGQGDPFTQHYSAGDLEQFAPSMDGIEPVDLENGEGEALEGLYAVPVGKKEQLNNNTNYAQFLIAALDAGFPRERVTASCDFLEGTRAHFNRIPQKKRSGIVSQPTEGQQKRSNDILVITQLLEDAKPAPKGKAAASKPNGQGGRPTSAPATKAAPAKAAPAGDDVDAQLTELITNALAEAIEGGESGLSTAGLGKLALNGLSGPAKGKGIKRIKEAEFLANSEVWAYDEENGMLIPIE